MNNLPHNMQSGKIPVAKMRSNKPDDQQTAMYSLVKKKKMRLKASKKEKKGKGDDANEVNPKTQTLLGQQCKDQSKGVAIWWIGAQTRGNKYQQVVIEALIRVKWEALCGGHWGTH